MFRRLLRELHMLPRWEQRALLLLSLLMILTLAARLGFRALPKGGPDDLKEFEAEAKALIAAYQAAGVPGDTSRELKGAKRPGLTTSFPDVASPGNRAPKSSLPVSPVQYEDLPGTGVRSRRHWIQPGEIGINGSDSSDLLPLPGIGPVLAGRIVRYRALLGGYVSVDQLSSVYGMEMETLDRIRKYLFVDTTLVRKLDINRADFRSLLRHPYLQYDDVRALMEYRNFNPRIGSVGEIGKNRIWSDSTVIRMAPYLSFDP